MMSTIPLHEVEGNLNSPQDPGLFFLELRGRLRGREAKDMSAHEIEDWLAEGGRELLRLLLQEHMDERGPGRVGRGLRVVSKSGERDGNETAVSRIVSFTNTRDRSIKHTSQFGTVDVLRTIYSRSGERSIVPLAQELQLPKRSYSYPVQRKLATAVARGPYLEAIKNLKENTGLTVASAHVDEIIRDVAADFDAFYASRTPPAGEVTSGILVAAVDGKGVPMRFPPSEEPPAKRLNPGEKRGKKKEARVAAVYTTAPHFRTKEDIVKELSREERKSLPKRPRPEDKRLWASLEKSKDQVFDEVANEMKLRDPGREKIWVAVTDGDKALQTRAENFLKKAAPVFYLILDLYHVLEYLWKAGHAFHGKAKKKQNNAEKNENKAKEEMTAERWVTDRLLLLLDGKVSEVARGMRQSATKRKLKGEKRKAVDSAANYFLRCKEYMRYDEYLQLGLPIGSGAAEGACLNLVKDRLERTGMSWLMRNAEAVLRLRSIDLCDDTDDYWNFHIQKEQERLHGDRRWSAM